MTNSIYAFYPLLIALVSTDGIHNNQQQHDKIDQIEKVAASLTCKKVVTKECTVKTSALLIPHDVTRTPSMTLAIHHDHGPTKPGYPVPA